MQAVSAIVTLATEPSSIEGLTQDQMQAAARAGVVLGVVFSFMLAALFLWLTIMVRKGRNWARITSTVSLALGIVAGALRFNDVSFLSVIGMVMLLLEIAVFVMLWLPPSNEYFRPSGRVPF